MLDPTSRVLVPMIARAIEGLDQIADLLVAIHDSRSTPDLISALVLEALTRVEASTLSLNLEMIDDASIGSPAAKPLAKPADFT